MKSKLAMLAMPFHCIALLVSIFLVFQMDDLIFSKFFNALSVVLMLLLFRNISRQDHV